MYSSFYSSSSPTLFIPCWRNHDSAGGKRKVVWSVFSLCKLFTILAHYLGWEYAVLHTTVSLHPLPPASGWCGRVRQPIRSCGGGMTPTARSWWEPISSCGPGWPNRNLIRSRSNLSNCVFSNKSPQSWKDTCCNYVSLPGHK